MANEIVSTIRLDGEQEYNRALKQANTQLKTLRSALKAETAELGANATAQEKNAKKIESLKKQIGEQEKIVQTLKEAYEQARKEMQEHPEVIAKWEQKYNQARTTLANMKNELSGVGEAFDDVKDATASTILETNAFADSFSRIGSLAGGMASTLEGIFSAVTASVAGAITQLWDDVMEVAAQANAWEDIAGFWNTSATNIQKWSYAVKGAHNNFDDLNNVVSRLILGGKDKDLVEMLGLSDVNYEDKWEFAMSCMDALYEKRKQGEDITPIMETIFGEKKSKNVLDLLNDWGTIQDNLARFDAEHGGLGMTEEQMADMSKLAEDVDRIAATWDAFKKSFVAGVFGKIGLEMAGDAQKILDSFIAYMDADSAEEKAQALETMKESIESFFMSIGEIISNASSLLAGIGGDLSESENGIVSAIGKMMIELSKAMEWFADPSNWDKVKTFFEALFDIWLVGKGAQFIAKIGEAVASLKTLKLFSAMTGGASSAAGAGAGSATGAGVGGVSAGVGLFNVIGNKMTEMSSNVAGVLNTVGATTIGAYWDWFTHNTSLGRSVTGQQTWDDFTSDVSNYVEDVKDNADTFFEDWGNVFHNIEEGIYGPTENTGDDHAEGGLFTGWSDAEIEAAQAYWDKRYSADPFAIDDLYDVLQSQEKVDGLISAIEDFIGAGKQDEENLPSNWWKSASMFTTDPSVWNGNNITSSDITAFRGIPAAIASSVHSGMSGISVTMDGAVVGRLVAPTVSRYIATQIP